MNPIIKNALANAGGAVAYIVAIASFLFYVAKDFGPDTVLIPIMMLMLLVFSVALMGVLFFGRPVLWCLDGKKQEAVTLLVATLLIFFIFTLIVFFCVMLF